MLCNFGVANGRAYCAALITNVGKLKEIGINVELPDVANCINSTEFVCH